MRRNFETADCANGFVVWSEEEVAERLATLLGNPDLVESLWDAYAEA